jgi:hypothetical protein
MNYLPSEKMQWVHNWMAQTCISRYQLRAVPNTVVVIGGDSGGRSRQPKPQQPPVGLTQKQHQTNTHTRKRGGQERTRADDGTCVTGLSLQMKRTFSGGFASASGRSPIISSTTARPCASFSRTVRVSSSSSIVSSMGTQSSSSRTSAPCEIQSQVSGMFEKKKSRVGRSPSCFCNTMPNGILFSFSG